MYKIPRYTCAAYASCGKKLKQHTGFQKCNSEQIKDGGPFCATLYATDELEKLPSIEYRGQTDRVTAFDLDLIE